MGTQGMTRPRSTATLRRAARRSACNVVGFGCRFAVSCLVARYDREIPTGANPLNGWQLKMGLEVLCRKCLVFGREVVDRLLSRLG